MEFALKPANILTDSLSSLSTLARDFNFDYKFKLNLNKEVINEAFEKREIIRLDGFLLSIMFISNSVIEHSEESFIGVLEPGEAEKMREELKIFKKRFNDSFARKNKILFGH